jgi:RNA polymerase sigma-70 factor, ECF subfamily
MRLRNAPNRRCGLPAATGSPVGPEPADDLKYSPLGVALRGLPLHERQVIVLHYLADLPVYAIARESGLPLGTVKTRLAAGRRHLEQCLMKCPEGVA